MADPKNGTPRPQSAPAVIQPALHRRVLLKLFGAAGLGAAANQALPGCESSETGTSEGELKEEIFEYIVVGSGAGGGPLACNLARNGHKVLLLEAGDDQGARIEYQVPAFHGASTEVDAMRWDFFVQHYDDANQQKKDTKAVPGKGVLYPRAGTVGGCTAHNAMITVLPHDSDWNHIAQLTGDNSWSAPNMRKYWQFVEKNQYLGNGDDKTGHGFNGWLNTERADATLGLKDLKVLSIVKSAALEFVDSAKKGFFGSLFADVRELMAVLNRDFNSGAPGRDQTEGLVSIPLATNQGKRRGVREFIFETVAAKKPLTLRTKALVTRVLYDTKPGPNGSKKVVGVEYLDGGHLYRADPLAPKSGAGGKPVVVKASREVILAGGAFNTPQLLMLSGIGAKADLQAMGIAPVVDLPGVGKNLQDRYEVGVITKFGSDFSILGKCNFGKAPDPCLDQWKQGQGPYESNGAVLGIVKRSSAQQPDPDLFIFGVPGFFKGYEPGYSRKATADKRHFTWLVLKAHTGNKGGVVKIKSKDPRDVPDIRFRYFHEGTTANGEHQKDLDAVVEGVNLIREINKTTDTLNLFDKPVEVVPGAGAASRQQIGDFVKNEAWGHHASCTCRIGPANDPMAVLDSRFKVRGTTGLRVVDASVFPRIPGFFIVVPVYMVSEKATDVLLEDIGEKRKV